MIPFSMIINGMRGLIEDHADKRCDERALRLLEIQKKRLEIKEIEKRLK